MNPLRDQTELAGHWLLQDGKLVADANCHLIDDLVSEYLELLALGIADGGWSRLFRDPEDGRLWELTYPESTMHGGGPPTLRAIDAAYASATFGVQL